MGFNLAFKGLTHILLQTGAHGLFAHPVELH